ncbi:shikimate kinase [Amaricoccus sp.]|uniref:shikimate kinase n=1 Tax=Amaricoccus sp. TaxID=1872485 RepID=UPI001B68DC3D|nr:shikimate kinase [Amaricoccus sp.]MBP7002623.1 shikimate kinase [Amaricoccus sp.]
MIDRETSPDPARPARARLRLTRPLVLVGLMGAGKTSVGKRLAAMLDAPFTDSDAVVESAAQMTIPEIFRLYGEPAFRDVERRVLARLLAETPGVLATGGGAFIEPRTREEIAAHGVSVWLRASLETLWDRVRDRPGRPLLEAPDPRGVLSELMERRYPVYALADVTVESRRNASHEATARAILAGLAAHDRGRPGLPPTLEEIA